MTIYVDITDFFRVRGRSGIQRVIREVGERLRKDADIVNDVAFIVYDTTTHNYRIVPEADVTKLFKGTLKGDKRDKYDECKVESIGDGDIFFDIDNGWNTPAKRPALFKQLKAQNAQIFSLAYDFVPLLRPDFTENNTLRNYAVYVAAMLTYSDLVFCISRSTERDLLALAQRCGVERHIPTSVIRLGSDFKAAPKKNTKLPEGLSGKYILMVGTIEPRKRQDVLLDAYEMLARKHPDIKLVLVGKAGWDSDAFVRRLERHTLLNDKIFWLNDINDDVLAKLYNDAFIVSYLSSYEGYGLPVAEGVAAGKITIAFDNSSIMEAGGMLADYARLGTPTEVAEIIGAYLENPKLHKKKEQYIKTNKTVVEWSQTYDRFKSVFVNLARAEKIRSGTNQKTMQFVFISNRPDDFAETVKQHDAKTPFVKEYVVITPGFMVEDMQSVKSKHKIIAVDESKLLGDKFDAFKKSDHATKNWMLRSSIPDIPEVDPVFVMNDDDSRPLHALREDFFINKDGTHNAYYFYELQRWVSRTSEYDDAQHQMSEHLGRNNLELLLYSSHQPQAIHKELFKETVEFVKSAKIPMPIDEWSTYFNYVVSAMPTLFHKRHFETLTWPAHPSSWGFMFPPAAYTIENSYEEMYQPNGLFEDLAVDGDSDTKIARVADREAQYSESWKQLKAAREISSKKDLVHGTIRFSSKDFDMYVSGVPYILAAHENTILRFDVNIKIVAKNRKKIENYRVEAIDLFGRLVAGARYPATNSKNGYHEAVMSVTLNVKQATKRYLSVYAFVNNKPVRADISPKVLLAVLPRGENVRDVIK